MSDILLDCRHLTKRFGGVRALNAVDLTLRAGQVLGLVGENGAGKSTLINILGGVFPPDDGEMTLAGSAYRPRHPAEAVRRGVSVVHQELNLFPNLTIAENLFLNDLPRGLFGLDRRALHASARAFLERVRLKHDPDTLVERLSPGERQLVEIARALRERARLVILDEPTTSLTQPETERLFEIVADLRRHGIALVYISHNLDDVLRLADVIAVLRDGALVAEESRSDSSAAALIRLMVGRPIDRLFPPRPAPTTAKAVLEVKNLCRRGVLNEVTFQIRHREVLGIAGLMGSGRTELCRALFGLDPVNSGEIHIQGQRLASPSPARCMARGMAFLTEDRRDEGLLLDATIDENITLASLRRFSRFGFLSNRDLRCASGPMADTLGIGGPRTRAARLLSGGNQQKTVLAKWLLREPTIFLLDEPTRGVDIGAKAEIYEIINRLTGRGAGVLLVSSEIEELLGLSDRILVMRAGGLRGEFTRPSFQREAILQVALGMEGIA
jgi:ABC-type sugar transport system ATPase subunit